MKVGVIGLGLIGGSIALDLKSQGLASEVWGFDHSASHASQALDLGLVQKLSSVEDLCQSCELIVLATPVSVLEKLILRVLDLAGTNATVTDVGSTKARLAEILTAHPKRVQFVLSHPMAGTEFSGPTAALNGLFESKAAVICDLKDSGPEHIDKVRRMYEALRMRVIEMDSRMHDLHAAYVSHLSHISSFVLANTVLDKEKNVNAIFNLASAGFESTVRLAKSSPDMWAPIFEHNRTFILEALEAYIERLQGFHDKIAQYDYSGTKASMASANEIRRVLEHIQSKGRNNG